MPFWTLLSSNQKATLGTGRVRGSGPSGTSWCGVLVFYGHVFLHLGDTILDLVFFESESNALGTGCVRGWGPSGTSWHGVLVFYGRLFCILGIPILGLVFFESKSNVMHRPCPWFGALGHLLAWCSAAEYYRGLFFGILGMPFWILFSSNQKATLGVHGSGPSGTSWHGVLVFYGRLLWHLGDAILDLVFFESESNVRHRPWGCNFWTFFSSNQKATLGTGRVHGSGPSGTSWHGVLVFYERVLWHLGDTILDLVFFESESNVRHQPCPWSGAFGLC